MKKVILAAALALSAVGCGQQEITMGGDDVVVREDDPEVLMLAADSEAVCPNGSHFVPQTRLCATEGNKVAIGPFTDAMIAKCVAWGGGKACQAGRWDYNLARKIRGTAACPMGSTFDPNYTECVSGEFVYGPFSQKRIDECLKKSSTEVCSSLRWPKSIFAIQNAQSETNRKLAEFYSKSTGYNKVYNDVMSWFGTTSNGCVAFMSTALRMVGVDVPKYGNYAGERISLVTLPFSRYLREQLGWKKIARAHDMLPGDVVFTEDDPYWDGYPAHTYMFYSWSDKANGIAWVIDNQGFTHRRNIFANDYGNYNFTPFQYAVRAPR